MSASANTIVGFLPPNSSDSFLNRGAALAATAAPVTVPPVNEIAATPSWVVRARPALLPMPWTMLITPAGMPAPTDSSASRFAVNGVISDGFATHVLPTAIAGAIFHDSKYSGRFHGEINPTTPRGWRSV